MADRNRNRGRNQGNDWDWYYYEYRYTPYSPYLRNDYYDQGYRGPYYRNRDYDRDFDFTYGSSQPYGYEGNYGRYTGWGPSGYTRPDDRIRDDINDRLTWDGRIDATDVNVDVSDGIVTLTGSVDGRQDKRLAEAISDDVPGVWDVNNQLRVRNRGYYRGGQGNREEFRPGMEVLDRDGNHVGEVKEVRNGDFLLDRSMARDVFVPFADCHVENGQIRLDVRSSEIDNQGWMMPELTENQKSQKKR
jgi:hypothetical protein